MELIDCLKDTNNSIETKPSFSEKLSNEKKERPYYRKRPTTLNRKNIALENKGRRSLISL